MRAGIRGVLQEVPVQLGQRVTPGTTLAKVVQPEKLKAQLKIAETQAKDVQIGERRPIDTRNGVVEGHVSRIDPSVSGGTVTVDVALEGALPKGARPGPLRGRHDRARAALADVVYVGRPAFGSEQGTITLFRLQPGSDEAVRVKVRLGKSSVNTVEILEGLKPGDKVVLSDMSAWDAFDRVRLKMTRSSKRSDRMSTNGHLGHPARRRDEGLLHRRGRNARALGRAPADPARRVHLDRGAVRLRQVHAALDPGPARHADRAATTCLNGKPAEKLKLSERARIRNREIGFIFQSFNLIGDLSVYENVELPLTYRGMPAPGARKRVHEALEKVGMAHRTKHFPSQLSGGQQQRVAVARAIAGQPLILLADEPTGNLDSVNGEAVMSLLRDLHRDGATICMVTHDPRFARYAARTIHLFDGRVVEDERGEERAASEQELKEAGLL